MQELVVQDRYLSDRSGRRIEGYVLQRDADVRDERQDNRRRYAGSCKHDT